MEKKTRKKKGQGMTEYILIVALVAVATIAIVTIFGNQLRELYKTVAEQIAGKSDVTIKDHTDGSGDEIEKGLKDIGTK